MNLFKGLIVFLMVLMFFFFIVWIYNPNNKDVIEKNSKIPFIKDEYKD